jgi:integrase
VQKVQHHTALPYDDIGKFMAELRQQKALSAKALELTILTATRTSEAINAQWDEFDLDNGVWTIPAARMKADREHRVPLSDQALAVLIDLSNKSKWLFPSRNKKPLSTNAMLTLLKNRMDKPFTVHGFRSTFRDWAAEVSSHPRELAEAALAHVLSNKAEAAYQRGDLLDKRRGLMRDWADYIQESQLTANSV